MRIADLAGRRVAIWGYGREGRAALTAVQARLPGQSITVFCSEEEAVQIGARAHDATSATAGTQLRQYDQAQTDTAKIVAITTPPDAAALSAFDVVIKSPGISAYRAEIFEAQHNGAAFASGTALWFAEHDEARVIAVTGTKGKSTVSALIAHLLRARGRRTALAGNVGMPLLELLDPPRAPDWWVVELSSFQTRAAPRCDVGVIVNLYEEHLDWHGTRERYAADKLALADVAGMLVVNALQPELIARTDMHLQRITFGDANAWHVHDGALFCAGVRAFELADLPLPGAHNALNVCAALTALDAAGEDSLAALPHVAAFRALPHRLQTLGERAGVTWIDDSIATTPQATLEALASLQGRDITVLVGGHERGLDWTAFAAAMREASSIAIVTMGANGARIARVLRDARVASGVESVATLDEAVTVARRITPRGGIVLLSPGAPSFDQFRDYAERGCAFATQAGFDAATIGSITGLGIA
jgi:UDP-N-acetylmuramoyl-L-alanine---L-glutamate ligase